MNLTLKVFKNGKMVDRYQTHSIRRFYNHIRTIKWNLTIVVALRVNYGEGFMNEGVYEKKSDFQSALEAFTEK